MAPKVIIKNSKKRPRQFLSVSEKLSVLERLSAGVGPTAVGREFNLNESTVRSIGKNREKIIKESESLPFSSNTKVFRRRNKHMREMEKVLLAWIIEMKDNHQDTELTPSKICDKALEIHYSLRINEDWTDKDQEDTTFYASRGWFHRFKNRFNVDQILDPKTEPQEDSDDGHILHGLHFINEGKYHFLEKDLPEQETAVQAVDFDSNIYVECDNQNIKLGNNIDDEPQDIIKVKVECDEVDVSNEFLCDSSNSTSIEPSTSNSSTVSRLNPDFQPEVTLNTNSPSPNNIMYNSNDTISHSTHDKDDLDIFGESIAAQIRSIQSPYYRSLAKMEVQKALHEIEKFMMTKKN